PEATLRQRQRQSAGAAPGIQNPASRKPLRVDEPEEAGTVGGGIPVPAVQVVVAGETPIGVVTLAHDLSILVAAPGGRSTGPWSCTRNSEAYRPAPSRTQSPSGEGSISVKVSDGAG